MSNSIKMPNGGNKNNTLAFCRCASPWTGSPSKRTFQVDFEMEFVQCYYFGCFNHTWDGGSVQCSKDNLTWDTIFNKGGRSQSNERIDVKGKGYKYIRANLNPGTPSENAHIVCIGFAINTKLEL